MSDATLAATVNHSGGSYPIKVGWGILDNLGDIVTELGFSGPVYIISDSNVMNPYGRQVQWALQKSGIKAHSFVFPAGEQSKNQNSANEIYKWLVDRKAERRHLIIAVGGGVVGDLAGYVAATFLRGVPFIQVPTSMASMVDASIGGKVAVNLPQGKNLIGAFYQPKAVIADVASLRSLGKRELSEGWAEAIKHGFIVDQQLVDVFEDNSQALMELEPELSTDVIKRSMAIKANIVSQDERETLGLRILLNYGHTVGHALEASTEYGRFMHGEGVSVGMVAASKIAQHMGLIDEELVQRHLKLLTQYNLPINAENINIEAFNNAMALDKKSLSGRNQWVLLDSIGKAITRHDVPVEIVQNVVSELIN
ncbi:MAG: 3-dehydroquinate synthase [Dehalococcoidia bacterium]|tara:strand:- start:500 stop:1600 length:1101 start_codon:yes stop_codon:yes gene_type:complete